MLVQTSRDTRWTTPDSYKSGPSLPPASIELLLRARPALVGVDFWGVDDTSDPARPRTRGCSGPASPSSSVSATSAPFPVREFAELDGE
ncbi:hypothetical protein D7V93_00055 [Corallococcus llansteffanensis]|uniref:Uncharacterized protein n=1 Tax=Corallococcus llansteffanensis TaxID=2316731 RepID=A0A3A8QWD4_9BACT|nr:hypothetical protein D7V93_00055 [Corallococcus llansteffanensis]